eukprot:3653211-Pyramimonas_sp.AAC.1
MALASRGHPLEAKWRGRLGTALGCKGGALEAVSSRAPSRAISRHHENQLGLPGAAQGPF